MPKDWWMIERDAEVETFGEMLARLRTARGLHQTEVEDAVGMKRQYLSRYELGTKANISFQMLRKLEEFFELEPNTLRDVRIRDEERKEKELRKIPGPSLVVPDVPAVRDLLQVVYRMEDDQLRDAVRTIRLLAEPKPRQERSATGDSA